MRQQTAACLRRWKWKPINTVMSGVCGDFSAFSPCPWLCALSLNGRTYPGVSSNSLDVVFGKHSNFLCPLREEVSPNGGVSQKVRKPHIFLSKTAKLLCQFQPRNVICGWFTTLHTCTTNPRWRRNAIIKTDKSPCLIQQHFVRWHEIWHNDTHRPSGP